jgi:DNA polymerase III gamma/tau subunit
LVAAAADGGMRDALSLLEQVIAYTSGAVDGAIAAECLGLVDRRAVLTLLHAVAQGERADALTQLDTLYSSGSDLRRFADTLVAEVRGLLICAEVDDPGSLLDLDPEVIEQAVDRGRALGPTHLRRWLRLALDGAAEIARSGHPRTVLELMILRLADAAGMVPLAELLERLEAGGSVATPPAPGRRAAPLPRPVAPEEKPLRRPQAVAAPKPDAAPKTAPKAAAPPRREAVPSAPFLHALAASSQPLAATLATASLREHQGCLSGRLDAARAAIVRQDRSRHDIAAALAATGLKSLQIGDLLIEARAAEQILQPPEPVVDPAPPIEKPIEKPITSATAPEFSSLPDLDEADRARLAGWAAIYPTLPAPLRGRLVPFVPIAQEGTMLLLASETAGLADAEEAEVASAKVEAEGVTGLRIVRPEPTQLALLRAMLRQQRADRDPVFRERLALRQHETTQAVMTLFNATVDEVGL